MTNLINYITMNYTNNLINWLICEGTRAVLWSLIFILINRLFKKK